MKNKTKVVRCRGVLFGGTANFGATAGFVYASTTNAATYATAGIGSQLCL